MSKDDNRGGLQGEQRKAWKTPHIINSEPVNRLTKKTQTTFSYEFHSSTSPSRS